MPSHVLQSGLAQAFIAADMPIPIPNANSAFLKLIIAVFLSENYFERSAGLVQASQCYQQHIMHRGYIDIAQKIMRFPVRAIHSVLPSLKRTQPRAPRSAAAA
jgi:hypothetical protein